MGNLSNLISDTAKNLFLLIYSLRKIDLLPEYLFKIQGNKKIFA